jgi:hypothetical protein
LLLEKVRDDGAQFKFNGLPYAMRVGEIAVVDSQTQGLITHQIKADQKNKYMTPVLLNGGNVLGEVDRAADITVIPVADAKPPEPAVQGQKGADAPHAEADDHRDQGRQGDQDRGRTEGQGRQARHLPDLGVASIPSASAQSMFTVSPPSSARNPA